MATEIKKPTDFTEAAGLKWTNEANCYDVQGTGGDETTFGYQAINLDEAPSITFHTWEIKQNAYTLTTLKLKWKTSIQTGDDQFGIEYTKNGGGAWADLLAMGVNRSVAYATAQIALDANQDLTQVQVRVNVDRVKGDDACDLQISDIWTEGEYTPTTAPPTTPPPTTPAPTTPAPTTPAPTTPPPTTPAPTTPAPTTPVPTTPPPTTPAPTTPAPTTPAPTTPSPTTPVPTTPPPTTPSPTTPPPTTPSPTTPAPTTPAPTTVPPTTLPPTTPAPTTPPPTTPSPTTPAPTTVPPTTIPFQTPAPTTPPPETKPPVLLRRGHRNLGLSTRPSWW